MRHDQGIHHHTNATPIDYPIRPIPRLQTPAYLPWVFGLLLNRTAIGSMTAPVAVCESKDLSSGHTHKTKQNMGT